MLSSNKSKKYNLLCEDDEELRVDIFLMENIHGHSRSFFQKCIKEELLKVNGKIVKASYILRKGDEIEFQVPPLQAAEPEPQNIPLNILYEDDDLIVLNKQSNLAVHPAPGTPDKTLVNALLYHIKGLSGIGGVIRPGIVHRLDKDTSGVMLVAKSDKAHQVLSERIKTRHVKRIYQAIVWGVPKENCGVIEAPIGRNPKNPLYFSVNLKKGKLARTYYENIEVFENFSLLRLSLETGRTHQIRVHLLHIGHPIVGEPIYCKKRTNEQLAPIKKKTPKIFSALQSINRQLLHSTEIYFNHPISDKPMFFRSEPPDDFSTFLSILRQESKI